MNALNCVGGPPSFFYSGHNLHFSLVGVQDFALHFGNCPMEISLMVLLTGKCWIVFSRLGKAFRTVIKQEIGVMQKKKGLLGLDSRQSFGPRPLERRKMHLLKTEYSAGLRELEGVTPPLTPKIYAPASIVKFFSLNSLKSWF